MSWSNRGVSIRKFYQEAVQLVTNPLHESASVSLSSLVQWNYDYTQWMDKGIFLCISSTASNMSNLF